MATKFKTARIFDQNIGELPVFHEQVQCAHEILQIFDRHGGPPLLIARMQQGKTGVCVSVIDSFIKNCEAKGLVANHGYEVIYLTNLSDNEVKQQVIKRPRKAGLLTKVRVVQHSDLKNGGVNPNLSVKRR